MIRNLFTRKRSGSVQPSIFASWRRALETKQQRCAIWLQQKAQQVDRHLLIAGLVLYLLFCCSVSLYLIYHAVSESTIVRDAFPKPTLLLPHLSDTPLDSAGIAPYSPQKKQP